MNSLEAIISLLALITSFSILFYGINIYSDNLLLTNNILNNKIKTMNCVLISESFFSNSASSYLKVLDCFETQGKIYYFEKKYAKELIMYLVKEKNLEVKINEHYIN